jgi:hypothetical protein
VVIDGPAARQGWLRCGYLPFVSDRSIPEAGLRLAFRFLSRQFGPNEPIESDRAVKPCDDSYGMEVKRMQVELAQTPRAG